MYIKLNFYSFIIKLQNLCYLQKVHVLYLGHIYYQLCNSSLLEIILNTRPIY